MKLIRPIIITDAMLTSSNVAETDYAAYAAGTTYALAARVIYIAANVHRIYESLQASNIGHDPTLAASATWWVLVGATNRWRLFDKSITSQTSNANSIVNQLTVVGRCDSVVFLNTNAASVTVKMTDGIDGVVYNKTVSMVADSGIQDWYAWTFEPIERIVDKAVMDLPPYANAVLDITITDTGGTPLCGGVVVGQSKNIGSTQYGLKMGILDYSVKTKDQWGTYTITPGAFSNRVDATVWVVPAYVDALKKLLISYRSTETVYVASDYFGGSINYGFYKDFSIDITNAGYCLCTIQLEGLT